MQYAEDGQCLGTESIANEDERLDMSNNEKAVAAAFVSEIFKRSIDILKNMEGDEQLAPDLTVEESRFVKEFVKGVFKRAVNAMIEQVNSSSSFQSVDLNQLDQSVQDTLIERLKDTISSEVTNSLRKELQDIKKENREKWAKSSETGEISNQEIAPSPSDSQAIWSSLMETHQEFISYGGKNSSGHHIIYMDPKKAPRKSTVADPCDYVKVMDTLLTLTDNFIEQHTNNQAFVLVYRCMGESQTKRMKFQWMIKFYGILRNKYLDNLIKFIIYNPELKFKAMLKMSKAFMRKDMSRKLLIVTDPDSVTKELEDLLY